MIRISDVQFVDQSGHIEAPPENTLVLPSGITAADLKYRIFNTEDYRWGGYTGQALQLSYGNSNVIIALSTVNSQAIPEGANFIPVEAQIVTGIQNFQFADGTTLSLAQLTAQATELANDFDPTVAAQNQSIGVHQLVSATSLFTSNDTGGNQALWYTFYDTAVPYGGEYNGEDVGHFVLNGVALDRFETYSLTADQLANLQYIGGQDGAIDNVEITSFDGAAWSETTTFQVAASAAIAPTAIQTAVSYTAAAGVLDVTGTGSSDITLTGNTLANVITANTGNDTLVAGSGAATLIGGAGNDMFVINSTSDVVQAQPGGVDTVQTSVNYTAGANVEKVVGTGSASLVLTGNALVDTITANGGGDSLIGSNGDATLIGGAGDDTFVGGVGQDAFVVSAGGLDVIDDTAKAGGSLPTSDTILFGSGVSLWDLDLSSQGSDLLIQNTGPSAGSVLLQNAQPAGANGALVLDTLDFADGSSAIFRDYSAGAWSANTYDAQGDQDGQALWDAAGNVDVLVENPNTGETNRVAYTAATGERYSYDGVQLIGGASETNEIYTYADGSSYTSDTVTQANGSTNQTWTNSDGSTGTDVFDTTTGITSGSTNNAGAPFSDTWQYIPQADGSVENIDNRTYPTGNTFDTVDLNESDGASHRIAWSSYDATSGERDSETDVLLSGGADDSREIDTHADGSTYTSDTVTQADGSTNQTWARSDGSTGTAAFDVATGISSGSTNNIGAPFSDTWQYIPQPDGSLKNVNDLTYPDGSTFHSVDLYEADGTSRRLSWSNSFGDFGSSAYSADGSYVSTENDSNGYSESRDYDSTGKYLGGQFSGSDGGSWTELINADGSTTDTQTGVDGSKAIEFVGTTTGTNDVFTWGPSVGSGTIQTSDGTDQLSITTGVTADQLWFRQDGNNLDITVLGSSAPMVVEGWYASAANELQSISLADGQTLLGTDVQKLVDAMASFAPPSAGQVAYTSQESQALQPLLAANWH